MQVTCEEEWEVSVGKKTYTLNRKQVELLKEATGNGERGIVWFKDFAISIPHIMTVNLKRREYFKLNDGVKLKIGRSEYEDLSVKKLGK